MKNISIITTAKDWRMNAKDSVRACRTSAKDCSLSLLCSSWPSKEESSRAGGGRGALHGCVLASVQASWEKFCRFPEFKGGGSVRLG